MFPTLWFLFGLGKNANLSNNNFKCLVIQGVYLPNTNIKGCTQLRHTGFTNLPFSLQKGQVSNPWMTININICVHALFSMFQANLPSTAFNALIEVMCIFFREERNDKLCFVVHPTCYTELVKPLYLPWWKARWVWQTSMWCPESIGNVYVQRKPGVGYPVQ